jgi:tetratricopeptide (TPR) repeat protein
MVAKKSNVEPKKGLRFSSQILIALVALLVISFGVYYKSLNNTLTNWDDEAYITNNPDIRLLHEQGLANAAKKAFTSYVMGNYHPLTILSYNVDYDAERSSVKSFHTTNLIIHLLNTLLVFWFILLLVKNEKTAFITALLFAIHPMHVESVAWISERKDVLYTFFYLLSLIFYLLFLKNDDKKTNYYVLALLLFIFSLLSKGMAVSLAIVLFGIDYYRGRKIGLKTILEKIPFIILALIFGIIAIKAQQSGSAINLNYSFFERVLLACYALVVYLWKSILPIHLTCFYNYPEKINGVFPTIIYASPFILMGLFFLIYKSIKYGKHVAFGFIFFLATILLVIQIIPVGDVIIAERYTYIPYIGLFFIVAYYSNLAFDKFSNYRFIVIVTFVIATLLLSGATMQRINVWENSITLWSAAITTNENCSTCYHCRGDAYSETEQLDNAIADYTQAIKIKNDDAKTYYNRGNVLKKISKYKEAVNDYTVSITLDTQNINAYFNRANTYKLMNEFDKAIADYNYVISMNSPFIKAYFNRASVYDMQHLYEKAISDYTYIINANTELVADAYNNRGIDYYFIQNYNQALNDYTTAIKLNNSNASTYFNRAIIYFNQKQLKFALQDFNTAKQLGYVVDENIISKIKNELGI